MDMKMNERRPQKELRSDTATSMDSAASIRRAGGEDPRRYEAKILIDHVVGNNDRSGYNHNATSSQPANMGRENEMQMNQMNKKSMGMGTPNPDGTYSR